MEIKKNNQKHCVIIYFEIFEDIKHICKRGPLYLHCRAGRGSSFFLLTGIHFSSQQNNERYIGGARR